MSLHYERCRQCFAVLDYTSTDTIVTNIRWNIILVRCLESKKVRHVQSEVANT